MKVLTHILLCFYCLILLSACITSKQQSSASKSALGTATLSNGLDVVFFESPKVPLVTLVLAVKAGAFTESPETSGLTHLWEHMFFKGNAEIPDQEAFNDRIRELGIVYNGDTSAEMVRYYFTLPSAFLEEGLAFMFHAINSPLFDQEELTREIEVVLDEYDRAASRPSFELNRFRRDYIYGDKAYLRDPLGERDIIINTTREQLISMKDQVFVPKNSALLISGDVKKDKAIKLVKKYFDKWPNPENWQKPPRNQFPDYPKKGRLIANHPQASNPQISHSFQGPIVSDDPKATYAADTLIGLLRLRTGRFNQKYVESGLSYSAGLSFYTQSQVGELHLSASPRSENITKVEKMLLEEPKLWLEADYFTEEQLEDVKRSLSISHKYEVNKPSEYIKNLAFWWSITGLDYYDSYTDKLRQVTLDDIRSFVKDYLIDKPYVTSILVSPQDAKVHNLETNLDKIRQQLEQNQRGA